MPVCEVCKKSTAVGEVAFPHKTSGCVDIASMCMSCVHNGYWPYWVLLSHTYMNGGLDKCTPGYMNIVKCTLEFLNVTMEQFKEDVTEHEKMCNELHEQLVVNPNQENK